MVEKLHRVSSVHGEIKTLVDKIDEIIQAVNDIQDAIRIQEARAVLPHEDSSTEGNNPEGSKGVRQSIKGKKDTGN